nr:hypothetical protein [Nocardia mangyaensis]
MRQFAEGTDGRVEIGDVGERSTAGSLQQHREVIVIALEQMHGPASVPGGECVWFENVARVRERDLDGSGR